MQKTNVENKKLVSVIIPAYKQEKNIKKDILNVYSTMEQTRWNFELIVVVDGFVDNTYKESKKIKKANLFVYGYENNKGKGHAVRYGFARASGDLIAFIDSGMDIDPNGVSMILEHMEWYKADAIVASKRHPASKVNYPPIRKIYSWVYHLMVRIMFGLKLKDTQSGLKVYTRRLLTKVMPRLVVKAFAFDVEMLAVAKYLGFNRIFEAPIEIDWDDSNTNFTYFMFLDKNIRNMVTDTLAVFYRLRVLNYYSDKKRRKWIFDKDLEMRINTGDFTNA